MTWSFLVIFDTAKPSAWSSRIDSLYYPRHETAGSILLGLQMAPYRTYAVTANRNFILNDPQRNMPYYVICKMIDMCKI
jgi:hypothetical protein